MHGIYISRHPTIYWALNVRGGVIKIKNFPGVSTSVRVFAKITNLHFDVLYQKKINYIV